MVEYHFTRADYMKDAFYAVMVGLAFAALIILYTLIKMIVQIHKSRSTGKLDLIPLIFPVVITVIAVVGNILGPTWQTLQYGRFLPFDSEEDSIVLSGQIESLSPVPYMRFIIDGKNYGGASKWQYDGAGPSIIRVNGENFYIVTAAGLTVGSRITIRYLPKSHMVLDCVQLE